MTRMTTDGAAAPLTPLIDDHAIILRGLDSGLTIGLAQRHSSTGAEFGEAERCIRMAALAALWAAGCRNCVDESLFVDAVRRNLAWALRQRRQPLRRQRVNDEGAKESVLQLALSVS